MNSPKTFHHYIFLNEFINIVQVQHLSLGFGKRGIPPNAKCTTYLGLQTKEDLVKGSACLTQQPQSVQIDQRRELSADVLQGIGS